MTSRRGRPVVLVKKTTREIVKRYQSIRDAANHIGTQPVSIHRECKNRSLGSGDLYWRYEDDFDPNESFEFIVNRRPVLAANVKTGHWLWFESAAAAGLHFYGDVHGVKRAMRHGRDKNGYAFVYADRRMRSERCEVKA